MDKFDHEGLETYNLSNLTMIAAQYDKLKNATNALSKLGSMPNEGDLENPESSNGRLERDTKDDSFSVVIRKYCTPIAQVSSYCSSVHSQSMHLFTLPRRQQRITLQDFFDHVFDKLRPKQSGFLPCIYRKHIQANGKLVAAGSSLAIQLTQKNYDNISHATGPIKAILEDHLEATEDMVAPHLQSDLHRVRTVKPSEQSLMEETTVVKPFIVPNSWE
jgi:hypothetical protein